MEQRPGTRDLLIAAALTAFLLAVYLLTLCPTIYLGDNAELVTAIVTGGIPHPPGYPLLGLLGRAALMLLPWGEPAWRLGVLSALAGAAAAGTLYLCAREIGGSTWASALGAMLLGLSDGFWRQNTRLEVYPLHVLLLALSLFAVLRYRGTGGVFWLRAAVLCFALDLAHHPSGILLAPALLLPALPRLRTHARPLREAAIALSGLLVTPLFYLLLLAWARMGPVHAWGRPETPALLWSHASGGAELSRLHLPSAPQAFEALFRAGGLLLSSFPVGTFLAGLLGLALLWKRDRTFGVALLVGSVCVGAFSLCQPIGEMAPHLLASWLLLALAIAVGVDGLERWAQSHYRGLPVAGVLLVLVCGYQFDRNWSRCDLSHTTWVRDFARQKLDSTDPDGVLLTDLDPDMFPVWYVQDVLGARTDVVTVDRAALASGFSSYERDPSLWYLHHLRRKGVPVPLSAPASAEQRASLANDGALVQLLEGVLAKRPLCTTFADSGVSKEDHHAPFFRWLKANCISVPQGLVLSLHRKDDPVALPAILRRNDRLWSEIQLPRVSTAGLAVEGGNSPEEQPEEYLVRHYVTMLVNYGGLYELNGDWKRARDVYARAVAFAPRSRTAVEALQGARRRMEGL